MKKRLLYVSIFTYLWGAGICLADDAPHQIGVFVLNRNIAEFKDYVIMETALPIRHMEDIKEVEIKSIKGFKTAYNIRGNIPQGVANMKSSPWRVRKHV